MWEPLSAGNNNREPAQLSPPDWLVALVHDLSARAAGLWDRQEDFLRLEAFVAAEDMPLYVAQGFAQATRKVPLDRTGLGIVKAAMEQTVVTSWAAELPDDGGSGTWLRAFQAERSVAVPLLDAQGRTRAVIAIALGSDCALAAGAVAARLRAAQPAL